MTINKDISTQLKYNENKNNMVCLAPNPEDIVVSIYINYDHILMMGYPVANIYHEESAEVTNKSMNNLINSLCASIEKKERINYVPKEKLIEDVKNEEYELTINTIEGDRVEINDLLTLQNAIRMLIDDNKIIYINVGIFTDDQ